MSGTPPAARYGHSAVTLDARDDWGAELVVLYGGTSKSGPNERKVVYGDVAVYRVAEERWFVPDMKSSVSPVARAFHSAVALGCRMYMFGGHISMLDQAGTYEKGAPMKLYFNDVWCLNMVRINGDICCGVQCCFFHPCWVLGEEWRGIWVRGLSQCCVVLSLPVAPCLLCF